MKALQALQNISLECPKRTLNFVERFHALRAAASEIVGFFEFSLMARLNDFSICLAAIRRLFCFRDS